MPAVPLLLLPPPPLLRLLLQLPVSAQPRPLATVVWTYARLQMPPIWWLAEKWMRDLIGLNKCKHRRIIKWLAAYSIDKIDKLNCALSMQLSPPISTDLVPSHRGGRVVVRRMQYTWIILIMVWFYCLMFSHYIEHAESKETEIFSASSGLKFIHS